jgi:hypothetical protein
MAYSAFWRKLRKDFERLQPAPFSLIWSTARPMSFNGELLPSQWTWWRFPDDSLRARLSAMALKGAKALGHNSEDDWFDELRKARFVGFKFTGKAIEKQPDGSMLESQSGSIDDVVKESITLCHLLEAGLKPETEQPAMPKAKAPLLTPKDESVADQLRRLREESRITEEQLAENVGLNTRTVQRHLADDSIPYARHLTGYERVFSKLLKREVIIRKMP